MGGIDFIPYPEHAVKDFFKKMKEDKERDEKDNKKKGGKSAKQDAKPK